MRTNNLLGVVAAVLSLGACAGIGSTGTSGQPPTKTVVVGSDFELAAGQSARVDGGSLTVLFKEVTEDSRCPLGVLCIWAGNGAVSLVATDASGARTAVTLNTTVAPQSVNVAGYSLRLVSLQPIAKQSVTIRPGEYVATLHLERL